MARAAGASPLIMWKGKGKDNSPAVRLYLLAEHLRSLPNLTFPPFHFSRLPLPSPFPSSRLIHYLPYTFLLPRLFLPLSS